MFKVTDAALALVAEELNRRENPAKVVRFCADTRGLHLRLSNARQGDKRFAHRDRTVFVVDERLARRLTGRTLDVKETPDRMKLSLGDSGRHSLEA